MKNKSFFPLIVVGCLIVLGGILLQKQQVAAENPTLSFVLGLEGNAEVSPVIEDQVDGKETVPDGTPPSSKEVEPSSQPVQVTVDELIQNERIIQQLEEIVSRQEAEYLTKGWLHIVTQTEAFITASDKLPNGDPVPTKWTDEEWMLLDDEGNALQVIATQNTGDAFTSQTTIFQDGIWSNLTLEMSFADKETYRPKFDAGLLTATLQTIDMVQLEMVENQVQGQKAVTFSATARFQSPILYGKSAEIGPGEVHGTRLTVSFSMDSGLPLQVEVHYLYANGQTKLGKRITFHTIQKIESPPAEILEYFNQ